MPTITDAALANWLNELEHGKQTLCCQLPGPLWVLIDGWQGAVLSEWYSASFDLEPRDEGVSVYFDNPDDADQVCRELYLKGRKREERIRALRNLVRGPILSLTERDRWQRIEAEHLDRVMDRHTRSRLQRLFGKGGEHG